MVFVITDKNYKYELEKLCRLFLPFEKFTFSESPEDIVSTDDYVLVSANGDGTDITLSTELKLDGVTETRKKTVAAREDSFAETERELAVMLFDCFYTITGYRSPWGILTGVRPAKLMGKLVNSYGEKAAAEYFRDVLLVSDSKTELCMDCRKSEDSIVSRSRPDSFSLYISVPFCPSRCSYCSFVSHSVEQSKKLIPEYVELLCEEIKHTAAISSDCGLKLQTIYIGGGTPTTLSAEQLARIMQTVRECFDMSRLEEYTVEAGRPDTITEEKLFAVKAGGATRISINPQTMNDEVLKIIGRRHTSDQSAEAFKLARKIGFDNINTDIIAGLNGDTVESFKRTVDEIIKLDPENITVHSLAMKRASNLNKCSTVFDLKRGTDAAEMVDYARVRLSYAGIKPYYMYRQSKTVGNLENVGYAKPGYEGIYNVYIMDETHTILACGASAVTKLREPCGNHIERIFNYKYPYEYISDFEEIIRRKKGIRTFYEIYGKQHQ